MGANSSAYRQDEGDSGKLNREELEHGEEEIRKR